MHHISSWEYPSKTGVGCNQNSPQDTPNFLQFLTELRATDVMKNKVMSAAAALTPFQGEDGTPSKDVSGFAKVLNHLSIMNYDVYGVRCVFLSPIHITQLNLYSVEMVFRPGRWS